MKRTNYRMVKILELLSDIISVTVGYWVLKALFDITARPRLIYAGLLASTLFVLVVMDAYDDLYSYSTQRARLPVTVGVSLAFTVAAFALFVLITGRSWALPVMFYPVFFLACGAMMLMGRSLVLRLAISARKKRSMLILCHSGCPESFITKLKRNSVDFGRVSVLRAGGAADYGKILAAIDRSDNITLTADIPADMRNRIIIYAYRNGKNIKLVPSVDTLFMLGGSVTHIGDTPVLRVKDGFFAPAELAVKRAFDFIAALTGLVVLSPLFALCAVGIKLDSPGGVFYRQERYTINKKRFNIIKFRTMVADAEKHGARLATENDERITRFGRILRACRLDELPQLINILRGEMSVVGPRPERPVYADLYGDIVKNYDVRYIAKAGLTGYAQVYGQYNTKVSDKVLFDSIYINSFSLWLDIKLIAQTVMIMFIKESTEGVDEALAKAPNDKAEEKS